MLESCTLMSVLVLDCFTCWTIDGIEGSHGKQQRRAEETPTEEWEPAENPAAGLLSISCIISSTYNFY